MLKILQRGNARRPLGCQLRSRRLFAAAAKATSGTANIETTIRRSTGDPYMANPGAVIFPNATNPAKITKTAYLEFYVGNAKQSAKYYEYCFGFEMEAYSGMETGSADLTSYVLKQNDIRIVLTSPNRSDVGDINRHIDVHGDGIKHIALYSEDAYFSHEETIRRGAESYLDPVTIKDEVNGGYVVKSGIKTYGDTCHLFITKSDAYSGPFLPGFVSRKSDEAVFEFKNKWYPDLLYVDHMVGNVGWHEMDLWGKFYHDVFGMDQLISFDDKDISTEFTALKSKVMTINTGLIKYPINEPAVGRKKSQIEEYLNFYGGPGVQHLALATNDIIKTVSSLRARGVEFLTIPPSYYDHLLENFGDEFKLLEDLEELRKLNILVDVDDKGYLLQIFTKPLTDRPTFFIEIIQRRGGFSFGKGNFKALFVSIEEEQMKRGTLVDS